MIDTEQDSLRIRVLVAIPETLLRRGLLDCIDGTDDVYIVGTASSGGEVLELVQHTNPSVVVLSSGLQNPEFELVCRQLRDAAPQCRAVLLTLEERREMILAAARSGARGLIGLSASPDDVLAALRRVHAGQLRFEEEALLAIIEDYVDVHRPSPAPDAGPEALHHAPDTACLEAADPLSKREKQVLALVAAGLTSRAIAEDLSISIRTVEAHRARLSDKLGIRTVAGLTVYALKVGIR